MAEVNNTATAGAEPANTGVTATAGSEPAKDSLDLMRVAARLFVICMTRQMRELSATMMFDPYASIVQGFFGLGPLAED